MKESRVNALDNHIFYIFVVLSIFVFLNIIVHILHSIHINNFVYIFPARIDDGCDVDNW